MAAGDKLYDLTCKKTTELTAGSGAGLVGDKFIMLDVLLRFPSIL